MPPKKTDQISWSKISKYVGVLALFVIALGIFRENKTSKLRDAANSEYEFVPDSNEPSWDYLNKSASIVEIVELANKGNATAQRYLAVAFWTGKRVAQKDLDKAVKWAKKAVAQGPNENSAVAALVLASIYAEDYPKEKRDKVEADKWLKLAADQGEHTAEKLLGMTYLGVFGGTPNYPEAVNYLNKASAAGDGDAIYWLGECYANGWGVKASPDQAIHYLATASDMQNKFTNQPLAQRKLAEAYLYGYGVSKNPKNAYNYFLKSALSGDLISQTSVASAYLNGAGVIPSDAMALAWIYVNRACGGNLSEKLVQTMERGFADKDLVLIRNKAREILAQIETNKSSATNTTFPAPQRKAAASSGTGVIISSEGLLVTAAHVVEGSGKIEVTTPKGVRPASVIEIDSKNDLAILRVSGSGYPAAPLAPSRDVKLGQTVFTIGFPNTDIQGASPKFTKGEISSVSGIRDEPTQWQISVPVQSGNSGSPLFDESGNIIGIVVSKLNALETAKTTGDLVQNVNYAVKNAYLIPMLEKVQDKLPSQGRRGLFKGLESVVEDSKKSVVLILAY
jgi:TPR repeat protein